MSIRIWLKERRRKIFRYGGWLNRKYARISYTLKHGIPEKTKQLFCRHEWRMKVYNAMTDCQQVGFICKKCNLYRNEEDM